MKPFSHVREVLYNICTKIGWIYLNLQVVLQHTQYIQYSVIKFVREKERERVRKCEKVCVRERERERERER